MRTGMIGLCVITVCAAVVVAAPTTRPSAPASRPVVPTRAPNPADLFEAAITTLKGEASQALRQGRPFPRSEPTFFARGEAPGDSAALLKVLAKRLSDDVRVDAYVKWQLLSAVDRFDASQTNAALDAYAAAPALIPMPGVTEKDQVRWINTTDMIEDPQQAQAVTVRWEAERAHVQETDDTIIRYRDALRQRISPGDDAAQVKVFAMQLEDLGQRAAAGLDADAGITRMTSDVTAWVSIAQKGAVATVRQLAIRQANREPGLMITKFKFRESKNATRWSTGYAQLDTKKMAKLIQALGGGGGTATAEPKSKK